MPLIKGEKARSKAGFSKNIETEMKAGRPKNQAVAIAYSVAERGKKSQQPGAAKEYKSKHALERQHPLTRPPIKEQRSTHAVKHRTVKEHKSKAMQGMY